MTCGGTGGAGVGDGAGVGSDDGDDVGAGSCTGGLMQHAVISVMMIRAVDSKAIKPFFLIRMPPDGRLRTGDCA
jgi:hypothetical protein